MHLPKEKIGSISLLLESPKSEELQSPDLENDFFKDSGAESNIINIQTSLKILHPKLIPFKTTSRLATAQGSNLTNYGKIQVFLVPNFLSKPFKQTFHITDIKHNINGIPFITKYIPVINILISRIHKKDIYIHKNEKYSFNIFAKNKQ